MDYKVPYFSINRDVFDTCVHDLPFDVSYELVPYANGTYDDLIKKVYDQEIDVILGDSTILENRSQYDDFTVTYTDLGVGMLARITHNDWWIFLKPLDVDLGLSSAGFAILTGFAIWAIESMDQGTQRSLVEHIGATFWFILMTLFFAQRERLSSNLSKFMMFIWLMVVLILISSYTATLASLLTVEQSELASKGRTVGFHDGSFVARVTISNLNFENYIHRPYYSYEDYANALSRGGKHGGADAIIDEIPYIKMINIFKINLVCCLKELFYYWSFYKNTVKVSKCVLGKKAASIFGFTGEDHVGKIDFPAIQCLLSFFSTVDVDWKKMSLPVMEHYTKATDGSFIEQKESALVWHHQEADPDFGMWQAKELLDHLESVLANKHVFVKRGQQIVEVNPQGVSKGMVLESLIASMQSKGKLLDFVLCIGDDRSDEDMFKKISSSVLNRGIA